MDFLEKIIINYMIIGYLKEGFSQADIAIKLQENKIKPCSLSSIEKRIKDMRDYYNAKSLFHLACILHDKNIFSPTTSIKNTVEECK